MFMIILTLDGKPLKIPTPQKTSAKDQVLRNEANTICIKL